MDWNQMKIHSEARDSDNKLCFRLLKFIEATIRLYFWAYLDMANLIVAPKPEQNN